MHLFTNLFLNFYLVQLWNSKMQLLHDGENAKSMQAHWISEWSPWSSNILMLFKGPRYRLCIEMLNIKMRSYSSSCFRIILKCKVYSLKNYYFSHGFPLDTNSHSTDIRYMLVCSIYCCLTLHIPLYLILFYSKVLEKLTLWDKINGVRMSSVANDLLFKNRLLICTCN